MRPRCFIALAAYLSAGRGVNRDTSDTAFGAEAHIERRSPIVARRMWPGWPHRHEDEGDPLIKPLALLIAATALMLAGFGLACNDDGSALTVEEYFEKVAELDDEMETKSNAIDERLEALGDDEFEEARDLFEEQTDVFATFVDELDDLNPPSEVEDAHDDAVSGLRSFAESSRDGVDRLQDVDSFEEAAQIFEDVDRSGLERLDAACIKLEKVAADNDIETDLGCDAEE
jgi:hypothetical protein